MDQPIADRDKRTTASKRAFFDQVAWQHEHPGPFKRYYNKLLFRQMRFNIPAGSSVLEVGCGVGDLLASLNPSRGLGIDFSAEMIEKAQKRHPNLSFQQIDILDFDVDETFDFVILSNLIGELVDVQRVLDTLGRFCHDRTRIIITHYNYLWGPFVRLAERLKIKPRQREQNWFEIDALQNLLELTDIEPIKRDRHILFPLNLPKIADLINEHASQLPIFNRFCLNETVIGRYKKSVSKKEYRVSVIVACKDERGNIEELFRATPKMGLGTELIFVDGHSEDGTVPEIERCIGELETLNPSLDSARVFVQPGKGKGDAVRLGFEQATGEVLMILDADLTVRPEDLPKFYRALVENQGEFINGSRLIYPMEDQAMRFLNLLGNHFFGGLFSWLLDQPLTDTLCGTKVLFKSDYEAIKQGRSFFGDFDPFGDFDLLFGAAKQNLKIREIPIRYRNREYGEIKISRFKHGLLLLKMSALAYQRFKLHRGAQ